MQSILLRLVPGALALMLMSVVVLVQWHMTTPQPIMGPPSIDVASDVMEHGPPDATLPDVDTPHGDGEPSDGPRRLVSDLVAARIALAMAGGVPDVGPMPSLDATTWQTPPPMPVTPEPRPKPRKRRAVADSHPEAPPALPALPRDYSDAPGPRWATYLVRAKPPTDEPWTRRVFGGQQ